MDNVCPEGTEEQSVTSTSGEALGSYVHVRRSELIINYSQWYTQDLGLLESGRMMLLQVQFI